MKKIIASLIVASLAATAPGVPCYAALASVVRQGPVPATAGRAALPSLAPAGQVSLSLGLTPAQLQPGLMPGAQLPKLAPAAQLTGAPALAPAAGQAAAAQAAPQGPMPLARLLESKDDLTLGADELAAMSAVESKEAATSIMDRVLGIMPAAAKGDDAVSEIAAASKAVLPAFRGRAAAPRPGPPSAPRSAPSLTRTRVLDVAAGLGRMALSAGAVLGLQVAAAALLPATFGLVPLAAVWAVSSGVLLLPVALYARYRLALRDSPRLTKVKWLLDASIGAFIGATVLAVPSLGAVLSVQHMALAGLPLAALLAGRGFGAAMPLDSVSLWASLAVVPAIFGAAAAGAIGVGSLLGAMALPAMTTVSFFLGRLIFSAETGRPFSVPGSLQKLRFPSFQWVMTGVVFALLTGYGAVYSNLAFLAWQFFGGKSWGWNPEASLLTNILNNVLNFNTLYVGLLAFTAVTGFSSPLTFLVIAFAPERASVWTESLLGRFLPKAEPAPSTQVRPLADPDAPAPAAKPNYHYRLKTGLLIGSMAAAAVLMAFGVFGVTSLAKNLLIAGVIVGLQVYGSTWVIKKIMKTTPADESQDPEFFAIIRELVGRINAARQAAGKTTIPMPEMVIDPMTVPNAYATGRSPYHALVGVTAAIKDMTLNPESLRAGLVRLLAASDPAGKSFKAFRKAIAGTLPGIAAQATPREVAEAVKAASAADLKKLGERALRGVLAHEMSHVMDRHMLLGGVAGAISSAVAFASYAVMWAVGQGKVLVLRLKQALRSKKASEAEDLLKSGGESRFEPVSLGAAALLPLLKVLAALWGPIILQITQMAASRSNEGMADEDGGSLSEEPEALALALGLLTSWRPASFGAVDSRRLPIMAANAHLFTVNPFEQLHRAGLLAKLQQAAGGVSKADDFLMNLFITHPDTTQRIERLYEMSEARDASR